MPEIALDILIGDQRWKRLPRLRARLAQAAEVTYAHLPKSLRRPIEVTVLLTDNRHVKRLNHDFRGIDKPTNVLAFPQFPRGKLTKKGKSRAAVYAGDVILGYQYIAAEAKNDHKVLINHITHLLIHGILHILGYDHHFSAEALRMERLETRITAALGLPDPYAPQPREPKAR